MREKIKKLNKQSQAFFGLITLIAGFAMMWGSTAEQSTGRSNRSIVYNNAHNIDASIPNPRYNGKLVVASAKLNTHEKIGDEYLVPGNYLFLIRKVEMFQWTEIPDSMGTIRYELEWSDRPVDFLDFKETKGHENPLFKIFGKRVEASSSTFGGFAGEKIVSMIAAAPPLELTQEMLVDPMMKIEDNHIVIKRDPSLEGANLGDIRIGYQALIPGDYTVMAMQADEMTLLGSNPQGAVTVRPGIHSAEELIESVDTVANRAYSNLLYFGGLLFFFGLASAMVRATPNLDLRPKIQAQGGLAVCIVAGGITLVVMLLFMAFSVLG